MTGFSTKAYKNKWAPQGAPQYIPNGGKSGLSINYIPLFKPTITLRASLHPMVSNKTPDFRVYLQLALLAAKAADLVRNAVTIQHIWNLLKF